MDTEIKLGGDINIGDFVCIANGNFLEFGWFCGRGQGGTFQYYYYKQPMRYKEIYENAKIYPQYHNHKKAMSEEFNIKWLKKSFLLDFKGNRIMKINWDVRDMFTNIEQLNDYKKSREILEQLNFLKK